MVTSSALRGGVLLSRRAGAASPAHKSVIALEARRWSSSRDVRPTAVPRATPSASTYELLLSRLCETKRHRSARPDLTSLPRRRCFSTAPPPLTLPSYKGGVVYLHRLETTTSEQPYALSFIPLPPTHPTSPTVIGYLPSGPPPEQLNARSGFEENPGFLELLHEVLRVACEDDPWISTVGKSRGSEGFVHIIVPNRTGEPEGIIASVLIDASGEPAIDAEDFYQPNAMYRLVTNAGLIMLPKSLHERVVAGCELARQIEVDVEREAGLDPE